jgi:hypothetical protein
MSLSIEEGLPARILCRGEPCTRPSCLSCAIALIIVGFDTPAIMVRLLMEGKQVPGGHVSAKSLFLTNSEACRTAGLLPKDLICNSGEIIDQIDYSD